MSLFQRNLVSVFGTTGRHRRGFAAASVKIYQYEICPFCCKAKAYLDWKNVPYNTVEVNPLSKKEIRFSMDYKKVPIARIDGKQVNGSLEIIRAIEKKIADDAAPRTDSLDDAEMRRWLKWADERLAVLLFPAITRNFSESFETFGYIAEVPSFSAWTKLLNQYVGAVAMRLANGRLKQKYSITDDRAMLGETLSEWIDALRDGPFLGGRSSLTIADVAVYGVLSSVRGLTAYNECMDAMPALASWSDAVENAIGESARQFDLAAGTRKIGMTTRRVAIEHDGTVIS